MTKHGHFQLELQVASITWVYSDNRSVWIPQIELHMSEWQKRMPPVDSKNGRIANGSITAFYQWYAPLVGKTVGSFI